MIYIASNVVVLMRMLRRMIALLLTSLCVLMVLLSGFHFTAVITQSPPGPKGPLALYVHTQETVDHTLLRVAVCSPTVVSRLSVHVRRSVRKRKSNYK